MCRSEGGGALRGDFRIDRAGSELAALRARVAELEARIADLDAEPSRAALLEAVDAFVAEITVEGALVYVNRVGAAVVRGEVPGVAWTDWIAPAFTPFAARALEGVVASRNPVRFECQALDGPWYEVRLRPVLRGSRVVRVAMTANDVTDRRSIDDQLARSVRAHSIRSELRGFMLEASDEDALFAGVRALLESEGAFAGVFASAVAHEGDAPDPHVAEALRTRNVVPIAPRVVPDFVPRRAGAGESGPAVAVPVCDGPHVLGILVAAAPPGAEIDETDTWLLADVARDLAHGVRALRARGERRTMEELLFQAQKMDAIGQLAGGVAHDFNNQLTGILGFAEYLAMQLDDADLRDQAELIVRAAERSAGLTAQLLAFARKGPFRTVTVDLHAVIRDVVAILERSIDKRIRIRTELDAKAPFVLGDPHQLQNALLNLALNARDAMPAGGDIRLVTRDLREPGGPARDAGGEAEALVCVEVVDEGTGIADAVRARMFEPFFTTKPPGKGTGMGLAAVYGTVQRHGGQLEVETEADRGSTFRVLLPVASGPLGAHAPATLAPHPAGRPGRVLVVDDEPVVCTLVRSALEASGYDVVVCTAPDEALRFFEAGGHAIDLVLLDMIMPTMNGRETFEALRALRRDVRVLLVSGYSLDDEAQHLLERGAAGFLHKPFTVRQLLRRVSALLAGVAEVGDV